MYPKAVGFLPIFYACTFLLLALCAYVSISVVAGLDAFGKQLFVAIMAFGAWSAIGYICTAIVVSLLHFDSVVERQPQVVFFFLDYFVPGLLGSWLTVRVFDKLKRKKN